VNVDPRYLDFQISSAAVSKSAPLTSVTLFTGLLREAEQQLRSALQLQPIVNTYLELCNVYTRLDLPNTALELLTEAR
jgi:hypothetical protein